jgi:hypothetical protein
VATGRHHKAADATNPLTYATPPADLPACIANLTEIKTNYEAHRILTTAHYFADATNALAYSTPAADLPACLAAAREIRGKDNLPGVYNAHLGAVANVLGFYVEVGDSATPIQGEDVTPFCLDRGRGKITCGIQLHVQDHRLRNKLIYGDIAPADGTEATDQIIKGSLNAKFTYTGSEAQERSLTVAIPEFDQDPKSAAEVKWDANGSGWDMQAEGEATGSDPKVTFTVVNGVAAY